MLSSNKPSFLQSLVLLILTGKLIKKTPCPFLPFVQWTWLYEHYKKHSLTCVLHRLQRQQTCPTCILDVISGAPAAWPKPPQPTKVYEDCLSLLSGCIQQADCSLTKEVLQAQRQHLSLLYLVKTKQLGNSVLSACRKGVKVQELPFPMQKILYTLPY